MRALLAGARQPGQVAAKITTLAIVAVLCSSTSSDAHYLSVKRAADAARSAAKRVAASKSGDYKVSVRWCHSLDGNRQGHLHLMECRVRYRNSEQTCYQSIRVELRGSRIVLGAGPTPSRCTS